MTPGLETRERRPLGCGRVSVSKSDDGRGSAEPARVELWRV